MSTQTILEIDALKHAAQNGGVAGLADHATGDVELSQIDQHSPPAAPSVYRGREALLALAEDLEWSTTRC